MTQVLDTARWGRSHWKLFTVVALNYMLDGVMFSIAPLVVFLISPEFYPIVFAANLLAETTGALALGYLADRYGRRVMFTVSLVIEALALILLFPLHRDLTALALLTSLMTFGIGGEFGAAYSAIAELSPAKHRGKALMMATNFWNIGAAVIAGQALVFSAIYADVAVQVEYLLASSLGTLVIVGFTRVAFPESPRWLLVRGREGEAVRLVRRMTGYADEILAVVKEAKAATLAEAFAKYRFRLAVLAVITVAQYVTYGMMAYYSPYAPGFAFGVESAPLVVFTANLGASAGAFLLLPAIDKARRKTVFASFLGGFISSLTVLASHELASATLFYTSLFTALVFSEWAWASLSALQSELFPTGVRASLVGFLTSLTGISGASVVLLETYMTAQLFLALAAVIWLAGLASAAAWLVKGVESAGKPVEELEIT